MKNRLSITLFLILPLFLFPISIFAFELDAGIVSGTDMAQLSQKAERVKFSSEEYDQDGKLYLYAESDYHAVADLPLQAMADKLSNYEDTDQIFSRIVETRDLSPGLAVTELHTQKVHNRTKYLGIGLEWKYTNEISVLKYDENEFIMHWVLTDCEEGNFAGHEGFWYLKKLEPADGSPRTYVRMKSDSLFTDPLPLQRKAMHMFTDAETRKVFKELFNAAGR